MKYVANLTCTKCQREYAPEPERYLCEDCGDGGILDVVYDYKAISKDWTRSDLAANRELSMWRYLPLLPVDPATARPLLRVGWTPVYPCERLARELGIGELYLKDEGLNPTASLKDRASALAVVKAKEAGATTVACSSTGNAASSLAGNIAAMGDMKAVIFVPDRAPQGKVAQLLIYGAKVISVEGDYQAAFSLSAKAISKWGWYNRNAAINPYLVEGKKTAILELAEQLQWQMPDWLVLSVGDGCTIGGGYKALHDLKKLGFIDRMPRIIGVQAEGCAPIYQAWKTNLPLALTAENTLADSIAVGVPRNPLKALGAIRHTQGIMVTVTDDEILDAMRMLGRTTGVFGEPAGVAGLAGLAKLSRQGVVGSKDSVALVITGNGLKDIKNALKAAGIPITVKPELAALEHILEGG